MNLRTLLLGGLALIFSGSAATGVYLFARQPTANAGIETVSVVIAVADVPRGVMLTEDMLQTRDWPKDYVPEGALLLPEEVVGRTVWIPLLANDPVVESKLASKGAGQGLAALIPRGMRAVTIRASNVSTGVAGFILPGNNVDVLWTSSQGRQDDETGGGSTHTLLQNVEILAVDQQLEAPEENVVDPHELRSVTLLVSPSDAGKLDLGQNRGTLHLSLRNPEDTDTELVHATTLLGLRNAAHLVAPLEVDPLHTPEVTEPDLAPVVAQSPQTTVSPSNVVLPIRTLRGTSSGAVYLRQRP